MQNQVALSANRGYSPEMWLLKFQNRARLAKMPARRVLTQMQVLRRNFNIQTVNSLVTMQSYNPIIEKSIRPLGTCYWAVFRYNGELCYGFGRTQKEAYQDGYSIYRGKAKAQRNLDYANSNRRAYKVDVLQGFVKGDYPVTPSDILAPKHGRIVN